MGIFSYTENIMYVYMKCKGHSFTNVCPHIFLCMYENQIDRHTERTNCYIELHFLTGLPWYGICHRCPTF